MKNALGNLLLLSVLFVSIISCRSDFEKIRTSGNADQIYNKAVEYYEAGEWLKAQSLFEIVLTSFRGTPKAEDIYYKYASTFYYMGQYISSGFHYGQFIKNFPSSELRENSEFLKAYSNYQLSPIYRLDQTHTEKAIEDFQLFINTYPQSERVAECNQLIDEMRSKQEKKVYEQGELYFDMQLYEASAKTFENLIVEFPDTENGEAVQWGIVNSKFLLAENSVYEKKKERFADTKSSAELYLKKYPDGAHNAIVSSHLNTAINNIENLR